MPLDTIVSKILSQLHISLYRKENPILKKLEKSGLLSKCDPILFSYLELNSIYSRYLISTLPSFLLFLKQRLLLLILCISVMSPQLSAQEKIQDGETDITAGSYGEFLKEVGKQDPHHFFEERNNQIKRLGTNVEYDYCVIKKEVDPSPKLFMSTLDAVCYSQWRNKKHLNSNKSSEQSSEHDFSYLEEKSISIQESGVIMIANASLVPNNIDPLLKSNMISFKLRESKLSQSEENSDSSQTYSNDSLWAIGAGTLGVLGLGYLFCNRHHSINPNQHNEIDYKSVYKNAARDSAQQAAQRIERKQITEESAKEHQYDSSSTVTTPAFESNSSSLHNVSDDYPNNISEYYLGSTSNESDDTSKSNSPGYDIESIYESPKRIKTTDYNNPFHFNSPINEPVIYKLRDEGESIRKTNLFYKRIKIGPTPNKIEKINAEHEKNKAWEKIFIEIKKEGVQKIQQAKENELIQAKYLLSRENYNRTNNIRTINNNREKNFENLKELLANGGILLATAIVPYHQVSAFQDSHRTSDDHFVTVGNSGNLPDPYTYPDYWGSVFYDFEISKSMVSVQEWVEFLNSEAVSDPKDLYREEMSSWITREGSNGFYHYKIASPQESNKAITYVSYENAQLYCNWLESGKKVLCKEQVNYDLNPISSDDIVSTMPSVHYHIPTNDEYQKARFYDPKGLDNQGIYQPTLTDSYGIAPLENNIREWTSTMDQENPMIRGNSDHTFSTLSAHEGKEDLGFRVVRVSHIPLDNEQESQQEIDYDAKKSQAPENAWSLASKCIEESMTYSKKSQDELNNEKREESISYKKIAEGYEQAAAFYITSLAFDTNQGNYNDNEPRLLYNAGDYENEILTCLINNDQKPIEEFTNAISKALLALQYYRNGDENEGYNYAQQAEQYYKDGEKLIKNDTLTLSSVSPFNKHSNSFEY